LGGGGLLKGAGELTSGKKGTDNDGGGKGGRSSSPQIVEGGWGVWGLTRFHKRVGTRLGESYRPSPVGGAVKKTPKRSSKNLLKKNLLSAGEKKVFLLGESVKFVKR